MRIRDLKYLKVGDRIEYQQYMGNNRSGVITKIYQNESRQLPGRVDVKPDPPYIHEYESFVTNIKTNIIMEIFTKEENPEMFL